MFGHNLLSAESALAAVPHSPLYIALFVAISVALLGEIAILTAFGFAAQGYMPMITAFACAFIGIMAADSFWFFSGRVILKLLHHFKIVEHYERGTMMVSALLERLVGRHIFLSLLFTKFLYGTRALALVYLATRRLSVSLFVLFNSLGTIIFLLVLLLIGWPLGREVRALMPHYHGITSFVALGACVIAVVMVLHFLMRKAMVAELHELEIEEVSNEEAAHHIAN
jgi:membrane protein DedA with SNARE-associated domain